MPFNIPSLHKPKHLPNWDVLRFEFLNMLLPLLQPSLLDLFDIQGIPADIPHQSHKLSHLQLMFVVDVALQQL